MCVLAVDYCFALVHHQGTIALSSCTTYDEEAAVLANIAGNGGGIAGDHANSDTGALARLDGVLHLRTQRILDTNETLDCEWRSAREARGKARG